VETKDVINKILSESYQTNSEVIVGEASDQSIMITKLPSLNVNSIFNESMSRTDYINKYSPFFKSIFETGTDDIEKIVKLFEDQGLNYMTSRQIDFFCPCSKDRMVMNLRGLYSNDIDHLFEKNNTVEIKCDYCKKIYDISRSEILGS
jgi:redox-regulated HSP33 family molecular chaperone